MIFQKNGYHDGYQHDKQGHLIIPPCKPAIGKSGRRPGNEDAAIGKSGETRVSNKGLNDKQVNERKVAL